MRVSPLAQALKEYSAEFENRCGVQVPANIGTWETQYNAVRNNAALTDFSFLQKFRIPEETGIDFLDSLLAGNVARTRFGRVLHTFLAGEDGSLLADCYVANNDEEFVLLCESIVEDDRLREIFNTHGAQDAGLEELTDSHVVLSVDGFRSWEVMKAVFGADILGLPYLSIEVYPFENATIRFFRSGKTSEFGYLCMAPVEVAASLFTRLREEVRKVDGCCCGVNIHNDLRLEGRFFNIFSEGLRVGDPLTLGLQWMIDFDKEAFCGREAILSRRAAGAAKKIIGIQAEPGNNELATGKKLFLEKDEVAEVVADCYSPLVGCRLGLAVFPTHGAYAGLPYFTLDQPEGPRITTISMPPIMPKSLSVKLDEV